jgi:hypothetical protein
LSEAVRLFDDRFLVFTFFFFNSASLTIAPDDADVKNSAD